MLPLRIGAAAEVDVPELAGKDRAFAEERANAARGLEKLRGDRAGQHSIRVNDQWRICFRWTEGDAHDVELVDYH